MLVPMAERLLPGLIQATFVSRQAKACEVRPSGHREGSWALWRREPGWEWIGDFAHKQDAIDFAAWLLGQHDIRPR